MVCCFLFIASRALLQSHAEFNRLFIKEYSYMLFCSYYSSMLNVKAQCHYLATRNLYDYKPKTNLKSYKYISFIFENK